ncbi:Gp37-like protein [Myceligenerans halotolerans]
MTAWTLAPRDADLGRTLDPPQFDELDPVERYNAPGTWVVKGPAEQLRVFTPGMGAILDREGEQVMSGQVRTIRRRAEWVPDDQGVMVLQDTITLGFIEDNRELWSRLCWPDPAHALTSTLSTFTVSHDTRTGSREALLLGYIADNLGPAAPLVDRRLTDLVVPASLDRGGTATWQARMDVLGDVVASLAEAGNLRVRVVHDEPTPSAPRLLVQVTDVTDVSANVTFGATDALRATGLMTSWGYSLSEPETTAAIAFAAGEQAAREAAQLVDAGGEALWGRRREQLVDRQTDDQSVVDDVLAERLAAGGSPSSVELTASATGDLIRGVDYDLGAVVGIELPDFPVEVSDRRVREVATRVRPGAADEVSLVVGAPGATSTSTAEVARINRLLARLARLERSR